MGSRKPPSNRSGFLNRLGIYCIGVAIGFLILGMFRARSSAEAQRRAAAQAALEAQYGTPEAAAPPNGKAETKPAPESPAAAAPR